MTSNRSRTTKALVLCLLFVLTFAFGAGVQARPKVAVVLGGGSARGFSHIGLLKALEEEGIPIDYIVGTSMGSVVAGLYAAGFSASNLEYMVTHVNIPEMFVPTIPPKGGFLSTERFKTFIDVLTDNAQMESLPIPFYTVVINLLTGEEETLSTGPLSTGIVASMSIPAMFPPVRIGDDYYVDGGMKSLVPVEVARDVGADFVIAVDVRRQLDNINHDTILSNVQLTLLFLLATDTPEDLALADYVITPDVAHDSYMDYDRSSYFIQVGYEAAKASAAEIRRALLEVDPDFPFTDGNPLYGYTEAAFAERFRSALDAVEEVAVGPTLSPRMALSYDGEYRSEFGLVAPFAKVGEATPIFAAIATQSREEQSVQSLGLGIGSCQRFCPSLFMRRSTDDGSWGTGVAVEGGVRSVLRYAGEWEVLGPGAGNWRLALNLPERVRLVEPQSETAIQVFRDMRGLYGDSSEHVQAAVQHRRYIPWNRTDFWEAVSTSTNWTVGVGAKARFEQERVALQPWGEVGLIFEARLFGLYPLRSRLALEYAGGDNPWSIRWTLGNW